MPKSLPFGALLGVAPPGVPAFSSDYKTAVESEESGFYVAHADGVFTGYKYQCVEYARRWLVDALGVTFPSIPMAYHIFELSHFVRVADRSRVPVIRVPNGANVKSAPDMRPRLGSVIIWREGGYFRHTGHVAIVVEATDTYIRIAEQNVTDAAWPGNYARELPVEISETGEIIVKERLPRSAVLGWLHLPAEIHEAQWSSRRSPTTATDPANDSQDRPSQPPAESRL